MRIRKILSISTLLLLSIAAPSGARPEGVAPVDSPSDRSRVLDREKALNCQKSFTSKIPGQERVRPATAGSQSAGPNTANPSSAPDKSRANPPVSKRPATVSRQATDILLDPPLPAGLRLVAQPGKQALLDASGVVVALFSKGSAQPELAQLNRHLGSDPCPPLPRWIPCGRGRKGALALLHPSSGELLPLQRAVNLLKGGKSLPRPWADLGDRPWLLTVKGLSAGERRALAALAGRLPHELRLTLETPGFLTRALLAGRAGSIRLSLDRALLRVDPTIRKLSGLSSHVEEVFEAFGADKERELALELAHANGSRAPFEEWSRTAAAGGYQGRHVVFAICSDQAQQARLVALAETALAQGALSVSISVGTLDVVSLLLALRSWSTEAPPHLRLQRAYERAAQQTEAFLAGETSSRTFEDFLGPSLSQLLVPINHRVLGVPAPKAVLAAQRKTRLTELAQQLRAQLHLAPSCFLRLSLRVPSPETSSKAG